MAKLKAFNGYCLQSEWAMEVAALPYDVVTTLEAKRNIRSHPYSFLSIDKSELYEESGENIYDKSAKILSYMIQKEMYKKVNNSLYLYELEYGNIHQYGIMGLVSVKDYEDGIIKKHEKTKMDKERDRVQHILHCKSHTGPVLLIADHFTNNLNQIIQSTLSEAPIINCTYEDGTTHRLYQISSKKDIFNMIGEFEEIDKLYIADGHHRAAAAASVANCTANNSEADYFLAAIFPKSQAHILAYHRVINKHDDLDFDKLLSLLGDMFTINQVKKLLYIPDKKHTFGMCFNGKWYELICKENIIKNQVPENLDCNILQNYILEPIFGISEPRTDPRLLFIPDSKRSELYQTAIKDQKIVFTLCATNISELMAVADADCMMPPKSTWFEPKLRSGFLIHPF